MTAAVWVLCAILLGITFLVLNVILELRTNNARLMIVNHRLDKLMAVNEDIKAEVADANKALDTISSGIGILRADLAVAKQRVLDLETAGVAPEVLGSLRAAVDRAQEVADALIPAVDPNQTTPDAGSLPEVVTDAPPVAEVPSPGTPDVPNPVEAETPAVEPIAVDTGAAPVPTGSSETSTYGADGSQ